MQKYSAKFFGVVTGIGAVIFYGILQINFFLTGNPNTKDFKPFFPFYDEPNVANIIGATIVSFIWGWCLGFLFVKIYIKTDQFLN